MGNKLVTHQETLKGYIRAVSPSGKIIVAPKHLFVEVKVIQQRKAEITDMPIDKALEKLKDKWGRK